MIPWFNYQFFSNVFEAIIFHNISFLFLLNMLKTNKKKEEGMLNTQLLFFFFREFNTQLLFVTMKVKYVPRLYTTLSPLIPER